MKINDEEPKTLSEMYQDELMMYANDIPICKEMSKYNLKNSIAKIANVLEAFDAQVDSKDTDYEQIKVTAKDDIVKIISDCYGIPTSMIYYAGPIGYVPSDESASVPMVAQGMVIPVNYPNVFYAMRYDTLVVFIESIKMPE